jgi:diaminopimelate decarboxylase
MNLTRQVAERLFNASARSIETPCFVFFPEILQQRLHEVAACDSPADVFYSLKANPEPGVLRIIASRGFSADVSTQWEFDAALSAGFPPSRLSCVGPWKPDHFLRSALDAGIKRVSFETVSEALTLFKLASKDTELYARVLLESTDTTLAENMAEVDSPFGLHEAEIEALHRATRSRVDGVHLYKGSDFQDVPPALASLDQFLGTSLRRYAGLQFGPGLGVSYTLEESDPDWRTLSTLVRQRASGLSLSYEIGRYLVAHSVALLMKVCRTKARGNKLIAILDGGITSFARTILTGASHPVISLSRPFREPASYDIKLCGPTCTPLDVIHGRCYFEGIDEGDVVAVLCAGAYGANLNFSGFLGYQKAPFRHADQLS